MQRINTNTRNSSLQNSPCLFQLHMLSLASVYQMPLVSFDILCSATDRVPSAPHNQGAHAEP